MAPGEVEETKKGNQEVGTFDNLSGGAADCVGFLRGVAESGLRQPNPGEGSLGGAST